MTKREFLTTTTGALLARAAHAAQAPSARTAGKSGARRVAKTTKLFKTPSGCPNALAATPEGLWIGEQKLSGEAAKAYKLPEPKELTENAWLVDWNGKVLKTVKTNSRNTSGMAVGGGYVWMIANAPPEGVFQVDMNSREVSHHQIPLGPPNNGGGSHGGQWHENKLWISSLRLRGNLRVDPKTFTPEFMLPFYQEAGRTRYHDITFDREGALWQVIGNDCTGFKDYKPALARQDAATGRIIEVVEFLPGSCDPHGLAYHNGVFYGSDAGIHPNWPNYDSPTAGWIFRIDIS